jgi:hypothetical protein
MGASELLQFGDLPFGQKLIDHLGDAFSNPSHLQWEQDL